MDEYGSGHPGIAGWVRQPVGPGGWARSIRPDGREVMVRYRLSESGRYEIAELHLLEGDAPITSDTLAELKIGQFEAFANSPAVMTVMAGSLVGAIFEGRPGGTPVFDERGWSPFTDRELQTVVGHAARLLSSAKPESKIEVPRGKRPYPDSFYRAVAEWYGWFAVQGKKPGKEIAEAQDVPVSTAHRWINEARKRGFLAPARRGRAG